jgi:archaellum component FlaC
MKTIARVRLEYDRVSAELNSLEANSFQEHQLQCDEISNLQN